MSLALWSESVAGGNSSGAEALAGATVTTTDCVLSGHMSEVLANTLSRAQASSIGESTFQVNPSQASNPNSRFIE